MKKIFYFVLMLMFFAFIHRQPLVYSDYIFPKNVNDELLNYINDQKIDCINSGVYAIVGTFKDTVYLNVIGYDIKSSSKLNEIISTSNRRIDLGEMKILVLSKLDLMYSSMLFKPNKNGAFDELIFGGGGFYLSFYQTKSKKSFIINKSIKP